MLRTCFALGLLAGLSLAASAQAQPGAPATVSAAGSEAVTLQPTELRLTIQLTEKGPTIKEVLAKLKARSDAAKLQIEQLAAAKESVRVSEPVAASGDTDRLRQMQMMAMRSARGGRVPKGLETPKSVTLTANLSASWPLAGMSAEEVLIFSHELEEKVTAADLAGLKEQKKLSPEEEELAAEMAEFSSYSSSGEPSPGEPQFFFVGRISDERLDQATAAAFAKAKSQARRLAKAAGSELGRLSSLSSHTSQGDNSGYSYGMQYELLRQAGLAAGADETENEAISATAGEIPFQVTVQSSFELK